MDRVSTAYAPYRVRPFEFTPTSHCHSVCLSIKLIFLLVRWQNFHSDPHIHTVNVWITNFKINEESFKWHIDIINFSSCGFL